MKQRKWMIAFTLAGLVSAQRASAFRPIDFTDADVAESRTIEFEFAPAEYLRQGEVRTLNAPKLAITFGIGRGIEAGIEGINLVTLAPREGEPRAQIADAGLAVKKLIRKGSLQELAGLSVAVESVVQFPGRDAVHLGIEGSGIVSSESKFGAIHAQATASRSTESVNEAEGGVIVEGNDYHGWRPVLQLHARGVRDETPVFGGIVGVVFEAHDGLAFDLGLGITRVRSEDVTEHDTEIRGGVTWQIGPRTTAPVRHWVRRALRGHHHQ